MSKPTLDNPTLWKFAEDFYSGLEKRFGRTPRPAAPVVYEFTEDRALLHQYYRIRETMYRKIHNTDKFVGKQDWHDKIAHILIARRGKLCVGGCRLIVREGDEDFLLPMEDEGFGVRKAFPHLPLTQVRHGEISRFAVLDDDESHLEIMLALSQVIIDKCVSEDLAYIFLKCPGAVMARNWRKVIFAHCGQEDVRICNEIAVPHDPDYPEIRWVLIKATLPVGQVLATNREGAHDDTAALTSDLVVR
jgi:hypothetical protein